MNIIDLATNRAVTSCQVKLGAAELAALRDRLNLLLADPNLRDIAIRCEGQTSQLVISRQTDEGSSRLFHGQVSSNHPLKVSLK